MDKSWPKSDKFAIIDKITFSKLSWKSGPKQTSSERGWRRLETSIHVLSDVGASRAMKRYPVFQPHQQQATTKKQTLCPFVFLESCWRIAAAAAAATMASIACATAAASSVAATTAVFCGPSSWGSRAVGASSSRSVVFRGLGMPVRSLRVRRMRREDEGVTDILQRRIQGLSVQASATEGVDLQVSEKAAGSDSQKVACLLACLGKIARKVEIARSLLKAVEAMRCNCDVTATDFFIDAHIVEVHLEMHEKNPGPRIWGDFCFYCASVVHVDWHRGAIFRSQQ